VHPDSSEEVWRGRLLGITVERWGEHDREVVEHPGAVAIVAVDGAGFLTLVRQLREPARKRLLELPAGTAEPGEEPLTTARRELREECGLSGGEWRELASFWTTPGFCRERMHLFAAEGVEHGEASPAEDEELEVVSWRLGEVPQRLHEIEDAKTLAGLLLYLRERPETAGS
jgi:ADP-ribose pyrophosphatase